VNVTVIDYGVGNLRSLQRGLERAGATVDVSDDPGDIAAAEALVLPGVGAFEECMRNSEPFHDVLRETAEDTPVLGICVGLQLLFSESEEGAPDGETVEGLDLIPGRVRRLPAGVKVPQMGWNTLSVTREHPLVSGVDGAGSVDDDYAYFVHSYATAAGDHTLATCDYGFEFAAVAANERGNVMGTQFHPEKSGDAGLRLLSNFVDAAERWYAAESFA
jgi:glutamine amidotransferase